MPSVLSSAPKRKTGETEMRNFDLYVSGILYGRLRLGDGTPQIRKLDVHTGALLDWQDLTEQDRDSFPVRRALHQRRRLQLPAAGCKIPQQQTDEGRAADRRHLPCPGDGHGAGGTRCRGGDHPAPVALDLAGGTVVPGRTCADLPSAHAGRGTSFHQRIPA